MILALSVGPIYESMYEVFEKENKTKRLKAASYFFSLFMKEMVKELLKEGIDIIVPYAKEEVFKANLENVGYFHDRLIAKSDKNKEELEEIIKNAENQVFETFVNNYNLNKEELKKDIYRYYLIENEDELKKINSNLVFAINKVLDSLELFPKFNENPKTIKKNNIEKIVNSISKYQDYYIKKHKVKSIEDIAKGDYFAVVVADGNSMGKLIEKKGFKNIEEVSKGLFDFIVNKNIYELTNEEFKGELIYAGGDDILAFLPIDKVFEYMEKLNERFKESLEENVSLSFGISINYKKFPLREAIKESWKLLYEAKDKGKIKENGKEKKEASFSLLLRKHSGQTIKLFHRLNSEEYKKFKDIKKSVIDKKAPFIKSFHHNLRRYENVILNFYKHKRDNIIDAFKNMFNEASEKEFETIKKVAEYLDYVKPTDKNKESFDKIFYDLSFIKFLNEKVNNETSDI
jgi:CRISPR-associated protein Cmr2